MKYVALTNTTQRARVDDVDFELVRQYTWYKDRHGYASAKKWNKTTKKYENFKMHRVVANAPPKVHTDHINHNKMDNRRCNLRVCTVQEHNKNQKKRANNKSGTPGVNFYKAYKKWRAYISVDGKHINIGYFELKHDARSARYAAEQQLFGEFRSNVG